MEGEEDEETESEEDEANEKEYEAAESAWGNFESHVAQIESLKEARGEAPRSAAHVGVASRSPDASCPRAPLGASGRSLVEPASFGVSPSGPDGSALGRSTPPPAISASVNPPPDRIEIVRSVRSAIERQATNSPNWWDNSSVLSRSMLKWSPWRRANA